MNPELVGCLINAILAYDFPPRVFDIANDEVVEVNDVGAVEQWIRTRILAGDIEIVRQGLAAIVYWGNANQGYAPARALARYGAHVWTEARQNAVVQFIAIRNGPQPLTLPMVIGLGLPGFSGISFTSKLLAFLNPHEHCVLDTRLARLATQGPGPLDDLIVRRGVVPRNANNLQIYEAWRLACIQVAAEELGGQYRCVDVERGIFHLLGQGQGYAEQAGEIYRAMVP